MQSETLPPYWVNCFLLTLPILVWNLALSNRLPVAFQPEIFERNIAPVLLYGETIFRIAVFMLAFLMPLRITTARQKKGLWLYTLGVLLYAASWLPLLFLPDSLWSTSLPGFIAPALTPVFWLTGIGLMGNSFSFNLPFRPWFFLLAAFIFLILHIFHASAVYCRIY